MAFRLEFRKHRNAHSKSNIHCVVDRSKQLEMCSWIKLIYLIQGTWIDHVQYYHTLDEDLLVILLWICIGFKCPICLACIAACAAPLFIPSKAMAWSLRLEFSLWIILMTLANSLQARGISLWEILAMSSHSFLSNFAFEDPFFAMVCCDSLDSNACSKF